jgi:hypothetical protein
MNIDADHGGAEMSYKPIIIWAGPTRTTAAGR